LAFGEGHRGLDVRRWRTCMSAGVAVPGEVILFAGRMVSMIGRNRSTLLHVHVGLTARRWSAAVNISIIINIWII
jgi:hypothetical protein